MSTALYNVLFNSVLFISGSPSPKYISTNIVEMSNTHVCMPHNFGALKLYFRIDFMQNKMPPPPHLNYITDTSLNINVTYKL